MEFLHSVPLFLFVLAVAGLSSPTTHGQTSTEGAAAAAQGAGEAGPSGLTEIAVVGQRTGMPGVATTQRVTRLEIDRLDATTADQILRLAPAASIQTNSRGETLVFLRNAGERQISIFYDGALLNVPWDNRIDLSVIPSGAIAGLTVAKGVTSVEYGANVIGGAVNLATPSPLDLGLRTELDLRFGTEDLKDLSLTQSARIGGVGLIGGVGYFSRDGVPLSDDADLAFNQIGGDTRTNTDSEFANLFLRAETQLGESGHLGLSLLYIDAEKGVAPEGNENPAIENPRFWRLPQWDMLMGIFSGEGALGANTQIRGSLWAQMFDQTIDSFESIAFEQRDSRQEDDNITVGARFVVSRDIGAHRLLYSFNGLMSEHNQVDTPFMNGAPVMGAVPPELTFRQWTISNGLEYESEPLEDLVVTAGASVDLFTTPATGDTPGISDFVEWNATAGATYRMAGGWSLRGSIGRKTRLPTMRELFGAALGQFLINPGLEAESAVLAEIGLGWQGAKGQFEIVPFANVTDDTIDQRNVIVEGERRRQRINLSGSRIFGLEMTGEWALADMLRASGHLTVMDMRRDPAFPGDFTKLSEKPEAIGRGALTYDGDSGLSATAELEYRGQAFSLNNFDEFEPLERSAALNLRIAYAIGRHLPFLEGAEAFLRIDNVTDTLVEPQLGLPAAGRWTSGGLKASF